MSCCIKHPGRIAVTTYLGQHYCAQCERGINDSVRAVGRDIVPRECFIVYRRNDDWERIRGTGCAHWAAHNGSKGNRRGRNPQCLLGYTLRVQDLVASMGTRSSRRFVCVGDIYVTPSEDHCGLVVGIEESGEPGGERRITIRHDSSNDSGTGRGVIVSDFDEHFGGRGQFRW